MTPVLFAHVMPNIYATYTAINYTELSQNKLTSNCEFWHRARRKVSWLICLL